MCVIAQQGKVSSKSVEPIQRAYSSPQTPPPGDYESPTVFHSSSSVQLENMESDSDRIDTQTATFTTSYPTRRPSVPSPLPMSFHSPTYLPSYAYSPYWGQGSRDTTPSDSMSDSRKYRVREYNFDHDGITLTSTGALRHADISTTAVFTWDEQLKLPNGEFDS